MWRSGDGEVLCALTTDHFDTFSYADFAIIIHSVRICKCLMSRYFGMNLQITELKLKNANVYTNVFENICI